MFTLHGKGVEGYDIYGTSIVPGLVENINKLDANKQSRFVNISRIFVVIFGFTGVLLAFRQFNLLNFWVGMYSVMLSFFPPVYFVLKGKANKKSYGSTLIAVLLGSVSAIIIGFLGTFILNSPTVTSFAPISSILFSYFVMKLF